MCCAYNFRQSSSNYYRTSTGCGANSVNANTTTIVTTCAIPYGTVSGETFDYPQSTTGNISGIFDMSGGAGERVMGHLGTSTDIAFPAAWFTTSGNSKYIDMYDSSIFVSNSGSTNLTYCTLATCGGHALNETRAWYSDSVNFVTSGGTWFERGARANYSTGSGIFAAFWDNNNGGYDASAYASFRVVLVDVSN